MKYRQPQLDRLRTKISRTRAQTRNSWRSTSNLKILFIVENQKITYSQVFPFYYYMNDLGREFNTEFRELSVTSVQNNERNLPLDADVILFQPWFTLGNDEITRLAKLLRKSYPGGRIIFLDSYAPLDLRFAEILESYVDLYVKKHVFRDRSSYEKTTQGDTNLVDFYEKLYGLPASPKVTFRVTSNFLSKLEVGPTFFTSNYLLPRFHRQELPNFKKKDIQVHVRVACSGTAWYQSMREQSLTACEPFHHQSIVSSDFTKFGIFIDELSRSKICFSPFGYGEVCLRDYEAIACGALLVKPDMSHVETYPNVYVPYETYVPVKWDFSDLAEKVDYYLTHENETKEIVYNAYSCLHDYCRFNGFVEQVKPLFTL